MADKVEIKNVCIKLGSMEINLTTKQIMELKKILSSPPFEDNKEVVRKYQSWGIWVKAYRPYWLQDTYYYTTCENQTLTISDNAPYMAGTAGG